MIAFTLVRRGGVAVITFDLPNEPVNKISRAVGWELEELLQRLEHDDSTAVVIQSGKPDVFIAGADIDEFVQLRTVDEASRLARDGQLLMQRIADFAKPVVAAIHGACLGGGLELALACRARIASDDPRTALGFPETQLGLVPAAGGSTRLPRLIGTRAALDMILTARSVDARKALRLGLVDEVVPKSILLDIAVAAADRLARGEKRAVSHRVPRKRAGMMDLFADRTPFGRRAIYKAAHERVAEQTHGHYPAQPRAIEVVRAGMEEGRAQGFEAEARAFGELAMTETSRRLVEVFFASTAMKKEDATGGVARPRSMRRIGVVGSGFMGAAIAGTAAHRAGVEVRMRDADLAKVGRGLKAATGVIADRLRKRRITPYEYERQRALLSGTAGYEGFGSLQLVIEAVFEDLQVKHQVIAELESAVAARAVIATNTSTIPVHEVAANAQHPERIIGMHFFSPVEKMPLLEVIPTDRTDAETLATAVQFGRRMGKTVIVVGDSPGFWVNRILLPYLNEAGLLLEEGVPIDVIDSVMTRWGFPVGPVTLLDEVGLDVAENAGEVMQHAFGDRFTPSRVIAVMRADQRNGRKNGRGFHFYRDGATAGADNAVYQLLGVQQVRDADEQRIEDRLVLSMLNEAAMAMDEGVVRTPRDADIGAVLGFGYPAFRGGPLRTIDAMGAVEVVTRLERLEQQFGARFRPAAVLHEMARSGNRWYPPASTA